MKVKGFISILLATAVVATSGITAFAAAPLLSVDYTSSQSGQKPVGFTTWNAGGFVSPKPSIAVETNALGKGTTDVSGVIVWPENADITYKPYVRADISGVTTTETLTLSFSVAAGDKASSKAVYLNDTRSVVNTDSDVTVLFAKDGKIYSYGQYLGDYNANQWYHFDVEITPTACNVYLDGKKVATKNATGIIGATTYLYYGMFSKASTTGESKLYTDDFCLEYGAVSAKRKAEITSTEYTIGTGLIGGIGENTTVGDFLSKITAGGATLAVVNASGANVANTATLAQGMKLTVTSADGVNKRTYDIDCLALVFTAPVNASSTRAATQDISVSFNGTGTVKFYVNGKLYDTVTSAPYKTTVRHTTGGSYSVKAVVTVSGTDTPTDTVTYTYTPNAVPTVTLTGVTNGGEYTATDVLSITASATDADGSVESTRLYLDGTEQTATAGVYSIGPLSVGTHRIYGEATDNEGGVGTSTVYSITVVNKRKEILDSTNFSNSHDWRVTDGVTTSIENDGDSYGDYYKISGAGTVGVAFYQNANGADANVLKSNKIYMECDMKLSDTTMKTECFALRWTSQGAYNIGGAVKDGEFGTVTIEPNKWYHYRHTFDIKNAVTETYVYDENTSAYVLVDRQSPMSTDGTFGGMRFNVNRDGNATGTWEASFDNIEFYRMIEDPYLATVEYTNSAGGNVLADNKVGYNLSEIKLSFNNPLSTSFTLTKDNVTLSTGGVTVENYSVAVVDKTIKVTLGEAVKTLSEYTLVYTGITDENGSTVPAGTVTFTTGPAEYDMLDKGIEVNGVAVSSLSGISSGDTVNVSVTLTNQSGTPQNSKLIAVLYSGNKCIGMTVTDITVPANTPSVTKNADSITVTGSIDDTVCMYVYLWSDLTASRTPQIQGISLK